MTTSRNLALRVSSSLYNLPYLLLPLAVLFWSANFVIGRAVRADVPPVGLAFWRWTGAFLIVIGFAWPHLRADWPALRKHWAIITVLAFLGIGSFNTLIYTGLQTTTAINALLLQALMPVLIVLFSFLIFRDQVGWLQAVGITISVAGAFTIIVQGDLAVLRSLSINRGDLIVFTAVVGYAGYSTLLRKRPPLHPLSFLAATFFLGALMNLPFYAWESLAGRPVQINGPMLLAVGYVMLFPSVVSYFCFNRGVDLVGANRAGLFINLLPVFGSILAVAFLGERFTWYQGAGILLIACGIFLATRTGRR